MADPMLSDADIDQMRTPLWEQAQASPSSPGGPTTASALLDKAVDAVGGR